MGKYGVKEVFDLFVYDDNGLVFSIDTAKQVTISRDFDNKNNVLVVEDALVNEALLRDILDGVYDNKNLRIVGKTVFRNSLTMQDKEVTLNITIARINKYSLPIGCCEVSVVDLQFEFPTKDYYGFMNAMLKVED